MTFPLLHVILLIVKFTKIITILGLAAITAAAQDSTPVTVSQGPPQFGYQLAFGYSGSNLSYECFAPSQGTTGSRFTQFYPLSAATNANPVVFTTTASMSLFSRPIVTILGATGSWLPINGTFTATVLSATTFSIPVDSTSFGSLTGVLVFNSTAPVLNQPFWAVEQFAYNGSNQLIGIVWLNGSTGFQAKCSDGASTTLNTQ